MIKYHMSLYSLLILSLTIGQSFGIQIHTLKDHDLRAFQQIENNHNLSNKQIIRQLLFPRQYTDTDSNGKTAVVIVGCIVGVAILTGILTLLVFQWRKKKNQARHQQFSNTPHTVDNGDIDGFISERKHLFSKYNQHHDHYNNNGEYFASQAQIIQPPHTPENHHERRISVVNMYGVEKPDGHFHQGNGRNCNFTTDSISDDDNEEISKVALQRVKPDGSTS